MKLKIKLGHDLVCVWWEEGIQHTYDAFVSTSLVFPFTVQTSTHVRGLKVPWFATPFSNFPIPWTHNTQREYLIIFSWLKLIGQYFCKCNHKSRVWRKGSWSHFYNTEDRGSKFTRLPPLKNAFIPFFDNHEMVRRTPGKVKKTEWRNQQMNPLKNEQCPRLIWWGASYAFSTGQPSN